MKLNQNIYLLHYTQFTVCFWMYSEDKDNYGTPFSYATKTEDNEVMRMMHITHYTSYGDLMSLIIVIMT